MLRTSSRRRAPRTGALLALILATAAGPAAVADAAPAPASSATRATASSSPLDLVTVAGTDRHIYTAEVPGNGFHGGGGLLADAPAMAAFNGDVYFLAVGTDANVYVRTFDLAWRRLGPEGTRCSGASLDIDPDTATMAVACRGGDGALWVGKARVTDGALPRIGSFHKLGGAVLYGTLTGLTDNGFYYQVVGTDHRVYQIVDGGGFRGVTSTLRCYGPPAQDSFSNGSFACRAEDGSLNAVLPSDRDYSSYTKIPGRVVGWPGVSQDPDGTTRLYVLGTDDHIYVASIAADDTVSGFRRGPAGSGLYGLSAGSGTERAARRRSTARLRPCAERTAGAPPGAPAALRPRSESGGQRPSIRCGEAQEASRPPVALIARELRPRRTEGLPVRNHPNSISMTNPSSSDRQPPSPARRSSGTAQPSYDSMPTMRTFIARGPKTTSSPARWPRMACPIGDSGE